MSDGSERTGAVLSILIVTELEFERLRLFVAVQVRVMAAVSTVRFESLQPVEDEIPVSESLTLQLTFTSLIYQPPEPRVPLMFGVMTGPVSSVANVSLEQPYTLPVHVGSVTT